MTPEEIETIRKFRDAAVRFSTSLSLPGGYPFRNEPGEPYHEYILALYGVESLLDAARRAST